MNLKNENKNWEKSKQGERGYCELFTVSIILATLISPSYSVCVHFSGSQCLEIAALI